MNENKKEVEGNFTMYSEFFHPKQKNVLLLHLLFLLSIVHELLC